MDESIFQIPARKLDKYDVIVCGGGFAGVAAAVSAAKNGARTLLIESGGALGGDITKGVVPQILDPDGKGGFLSELHRFLNAGGHTCARRGQRFDENGNKLAGTMIDLEYTKYYLDRACRDAGVRVLYHSLAACAQTVDRRITALLIASEAGNYAGEADVFIDATGNGALAAMAGCRFETGHPATGEPQPASMALLITGPDETVRPTDDEAAKAELKARLDEAGIAVSAENAALIRCPAEGCWLLSFNNQYGVSPDDVFSLSEATRDGRLECIEVFDRLKKIRGFENAQVIATSSHIGIREGRRISGRYRLTLEDIMSGARFEDAVCLVSFAVDVHRLSPGDREDHRQGRAVLPYNIPYRALLPLDADNLLLAGRCISGDFYAHSSYRVVGDVIPTGEAAGYAAALCAAEGVLPPDIDGRRVAAFMGAQGYSLL